MGRCDDVGDDVGGDIGGDVVDDGTIERWDDVEVVLGTAYTGSPLHFHNPAINVLAYGTKRWIVTPPHEARAHARGARARARTHTCMPRGHSCV